MYELPKFDRLLTAEDFEPFVGRTFEAETHPAPVSLELFKLERKLASSLVLRQPFILFFRTSWNVILVDGLYKLRCGRFGPHEVFITPILAPPGERLYQGGFN
jgi:hypothetical protein